MHALRTDMYLCLICLPYADAWHMQFFYILHVCLVGSRVWGWTLPMCVYLVRSLVCMPYMYALYVCLICMQRNCGSGRCRTLRSSCGKKNTRKRARPRLPVVFICLSLYACPHMLVLICLSLYSCPHMLVLICLSLYACPHMLVLICLSLYTYLWHETKHVVVSSLFLMIEDELLWYTINTSMRVLRHLLYRLSLYACHIRACASYRSYTHSVHAWSEYRKCLMWISQMPDVIIPNASIPQAPHMYSYECIPCTHTSRACRIPNRI